jgi:hypothetical protein
LRLFTGLTLCLDLRTIEAFFEVLAPLVEVSALFNCTELQSHQLDRAGFSNPEIARQLARFMGERAVEADLVAVFDPVADGAGMLVSRVTIIIAVRLLSCREHLPHLVHGKTDALLEEIAHDGFSFGGIEPLGAGEGIGVIRELLLEGVGAVNLAFDDAGDRDGFLELGIREQASTERLARSGKPLSVGTCGRGALGTLRHLAIWLVSAVFGCSGGGWHGVSPFLPVG